MAELTLHSRPVRTVFDLLGSKEDDITYSVGWGLAQSEAFTRAVLGEAFGEEEQGEITAIRLQESARGTGRTDVEIETERLHLMWRRSGAGICQLSRSSSGTPTASTGTTSGTAG